MKRFFVTLNLLFRRLSWRLKRRRLSEADRHEKFALAQTWAKLVLRLAKVQIDVRHQNLIPLEDGYTFVAMRESKDDGVILLAANPLEFGFFAPQTDPYPWIKPYLALIDSIRYTKDSVDDDLIAMSQALKHQSNYVLFMPESDAGYPSASLLDAAYLSKTAIIPVAIQGSFSMMRFGKHRVTVSFCMPLHYEEYGSNKPQQTLDEIRVRIHQALKEG